MQGWGIEKDESCYDTPTLFNHLAPLPLHTLPQCQCKDLLHTDSSLGRAFSVLCPNISRYCLPLLGRDWPHALCIEHPLRLLVSPQIRLRGNKHQGCSLAKMRNFGVPLLFPLA